MKTTSITAYEMMRSFLKLQGSMVHQIKQTALRYDLTVPQFIILMMVRHQGQVLQKELLAKTNFPKSTLSHSINSLVKTNCIERTFVKNNRRDISLALGESGKTLIDKMIKDVNGIEYKFEQMCLKISDASLKNYMTVHQELIAILEAGDTND